MTLADVRGDLLIDAMPVSLGARGTIGLSGVSNVSTDDGVLSVQPGGMLEFKARADVIKLNGEILYTYADKYRRELGIAAIVVGLGILSLGIKAALLWAARTKENN